MSINKSNAIIPMNLGIRNGYSLFELLVTVTVIIALVALLTPVINSARQSARGVQCLNNLRQMTMSVDAYRFDWKQYPSTGEWGQTAGWPQIVAAVYTEAAKSNDHATWGEGNSKLDVLKCPNDKRPLDCMPGPSGGAWLGPTYMQSFWANSHGGMTQVWSSYSGSDEVFGVNYRGARISSPNIAMFWDSHNSHSNGSYPWMCINGRNNHRQGINLGYVDGHAAFLNFPYFKHEENWGIVFWGGEFMWGSIHCVGTDANMDYKDLSKPPWSDH